MLMQDTRSRATIFSRKTVLRHLAAGRTAHLLSALALGAVLVPHAHAQTALTWDSNTTTAGAQDGSGTWDPNTSANWYNGTADQTWGNPTSPANVALFGAGGTSGTVTLAGTLNVAGLTFNQSGYTLAAASSNSGALSFIPATAGGSVVLRTNGGTTAITDNVNLISSAGTQIQKTGAGTLVLSTGTTGSSATTSTWTVTGGTFGSGIFNSILSVGSAARLGSAPSSPTPQIILDAGTLQITGFGGAGQNILGAARTVQVNAAGGAIVDLSTGTTAAAANTINGPIVDNAGAGSSLYLSNNSGVFSSITSAISGTGGVTWSGGTGTFSGTSTYTGATVVNSGVMAVTGSLASGSAVTITGGTLAGTGTVAGTVTVTAGGKINPGTVGTVGKLTTGAVTFVSGSTVTFDFGNNAVDQLASTGLVSGLSGANFVFNSIGGTALTNASYTLISAGSFANTTLPTSVTGLPTGYQLQYSGNALNLVVAAAPEPSQFAAFGLGLLGLGGLALRARRRSISPQA